MVNLDKLSRGRRRGGVEGGLRGAHRSDPTVDHYVLRTPSTAGFSREVGVAAAALAASKGAATDRSDLPRRNNTGGGDPGVPIGDR